MLLPVICISGPTSTGKSTLTTVLSTLLAPLHPLLCRQDNYFLPAAQLPRNAQGAEDWDSDESINWPDFLAAVEQLRRGEVGEDIKLADEGNEAGVKHEVLEGLREKYRERIERLAEKGARLGLVEGFMVFVQGRPQFWDFGLFLNGEREELKKRREGRDGYATIEGWWQDPPGYFDDLVWPGYIKTHGWLFEESDVGGVYRQDVLEKAKILPAPKDWTLERTLEWILEHTITWLESREGIESS